MNPITAIVIGAGDRGARAYSPYALDNPHELQLVGVADPNVERRQAFAEQFGLSEAQQFETWEAILEGAGVPMRPSSARWTACTMSRRCGR